MQRVYIDTDMVSNEDTKHLQGPLSMDEVASLFEEKMRSAMLKRCSFLTGTGSEKWNIVDTREKMIECFESDRLALEHTPVIRDRASLEMIDQTLFRPMALITDEYERFLIDKTLVQGMTEDAALIAKFLDPNVSFKPVLHEVTGGAAVLILVCQARSSTYSDYDHFRYDATDAHPVTKSWIYYVMMV